MPALPEIQIEVIGGYATATKIATFSNRAQTKIESIIDEYSFKIQREAMIRAPVDTGFLRSSIIVNEINPYYNEIVATANYAVFVEFGTKQHAAQPFMTPAAVMYASAFARDIQKVFRTGWLP